MLDMMSFSCPAIPANASSIVRFAALPNKETSVES